MHVWEDKAENEIPTVSSSLSLFIRIVLMKSSIPSISFYTTVKKDVPVFGCSEARQIPKKEARVFQSPIRRFALGRAFQIYGNLWFSKFSIL
jgi:hypothetical protein